MSALIVIPARYASKRLPGKPLIAIAGHTLLERVVSVARQAAGRMAAVDIVVATDDARIAAHAAAIGCAAAMTAPEITSGTGRALAVAARRASPPEVVVNLQGDAPFVPPDAVADLLAAARDNAVAAVTTPVVRLGWDELDALRRHKRAAPFSGTTCVRRADGRALWFSKTIIPRDARRGGPARRRAPVARPAPSRPSTPTASRRWNGSRRRRPRPTRCWRGWEQLRFLELGMDVMTIEVPPPRFSMSGIDTAADVALAERLIAEGGDPFVG